MTTNAVRFATATLAQPMQAQPRECPHCNGRGYVVVYIQEPDGSEWPIAPPCPHCANKREENA